MSGRPSGCLRWSPAYIGLGSNLDDPPRQIRRAVEALRQIPDSRVTACSRIYRSPPMGPPDQPDYANAVAALLTRLDAHGLLECLQAIEARQGRDRSGERWGPRTLDLDLLVFGGRSIDDARLTVPHPGIAERNFVLLPLMDIAPQLEVPGVGSVTRLAAGLPADLPPLTLLDLPDQ